MEHNEDADAVAREGAQQLMATLEGLDIEKPTLWASAMAAVALLATASSVLVSGQKALNRIFKVATIKPQGLGIWRMVRDKVVSLAMLVTIALILSVSLMLDATAALFGELAAQQIGMPLSWLTVFDFALIDVAGNHRKGQTGLFQQLPQIPNPRAYHAANAVLIDEEWKVVVVGGFSHMTCFPALKARLACS